MENRNNNIEQEELSNNFYFYRTEMFNASSQGELVAILGRAKKRLTSKKEVGLTEKNYINLKYKIEYGIMHDDLEHHLHKINYQPFFGK